MGLLLRIWGERKASSPDCRMAHCLARNMVLFGAVLVVVYVVFGMTRVVGVVMIMISVLITVTLGRHSRSQHHSQHGGCQQCARDDCRFAANVPLFELDEIGYLLIFIAYSPPFR
jgi:hypothetical protein